MQADLFKKENNLFQSDEWFDFQKSLGRNVTEFGLFGGISLRLPLGKEFIWVQKGPKQLSTINNQLSKIPRGTVFVRIEPENHTESEDRKSHLRLVKLGGLLSGQASPKATWVLDISQTEEEILRQMKPKTRYNIRLSEKKGVKVVEEDKPNVLYKMLKSTSERNRGYFPHEESYYGKMVEELGKKGIVQVFTAYLGKEPLASILVSFYGKTATYLHGGFIDVNREMMAPYLCQWTAIQEAQKRGCTVYDFWGVAETDDPSDPWAGISRFKEGFGGEKVVFAGSYDYVLSRFWYNAFTLLAKLKHLVKHHG